MSDSRTDALLLGPRGRRLCMALAQRHGEVWEALFHAAHDPADQAKHGVLVRLLGELDPAGVVAEAGASGLMSALGDTTDAARYWEEPDEEDCLLADPKIAEALRPLAQAIGDAPWVDWWSEAVALHDQAYVQWTEQERDKDRPPPTRGTAQALRKWKAAAVKDERQAQSLPDDPTAAYSGCWWSLPSDAGITVTSRALPWLGAVQLMAVEDGGGWTRARVWPVRTSDDSRIADSRIYEVTGPQAWTELVERYPLPMRRSRRHDWWRATGRAAEWYIPDWAAVAADFDAVHLTVLGYLATAGRALDLGLPGTTGEPSATVLAGWDPDTTYWLTDSAAVGRDGSPTDWVLRDGEGSDDPDGDGDGDEEPVWERLQGPRTARFAGA
ncbi:hypothetical protein [Streptomyces sp. NPDC042319]|uniref:hypothetical protein n=1 Tax=Streptomyces sp. NPDC042319 TaxID=3154332 RepID=UPI0033CBC10D